MGDLKQPEWMIRVKEDYFKAGESFLKSPELPELLEDMDANGVERAILLTKVGADGAIGHSGSPRPSPTASLSAWAGSTCSGR